MTDHRGHLAHTIGARVPLHQLRRDRAHTRPVPHLGRRIRARRAQRLRHRPEPVDTGTLVEAVHEAARALRELPPNPLRWQAYGF